MKRSERRIVEECGLEHLRPAELAARIYCRAPQHLRYAARRGEITGAIEEAGELYLPLGRWREWCRSTAPK